MPIEYGDMIDPTVLDRAFGGEGFAHQPAGALRVRSGVVAFDPLASQAPRPFTVAVPAGDHPVTLIDRGGGALLVFGPGRPASWALAVLPGQDVATLAPGEVFGYAVSHGLGCFVDAEGAGLLRRELDAFDDVFDEVEDRWYDDERGSVSHLIGSLSPPDAGATVENPHGYNVVIFPAGAGDDGRYPTWVGHDPSSRPICLLTDFGLDT
jgi:hypothetical protein